MTRDTSILIFEEVFKILHNFMMDSTFNWVKDACSLLTTGGNNSMPIFESSVSVLEMAHFALEVLHGSFFCLKDFHDRTELVSGILSAIIVIDWECSMATVINDELCNEPMKKVKARLTFSESVHTFRGKISDQIFRTVSINCQKRLESILIESIKYAIFKEDKLDTDKITSLCCVWMIEVIECLCEDQVEEQKLLDQFLSKSDLWPLYIIPDISSGKRAATLKIEHVTINVSFFFFSFAQSRNLVLICL